MDKKPSGHAYRKAKKERELKEAEETGDAQELIDSLTDRIGEDPDEPLAVVDWVRKLSARSLNLYIRSPTTTLREKFRAIKEMADSIGKTENRRALESEVLALREAVAALKARVGGAKLEPADGVSRSPNSRGQRGRRGPRPLPGNGAGPSEGQD